MRAFAIIFLLAAIVTFLALARLLHKMAGQLNHVDPSRENSLSVFHLPRIVREHSRLFPGSPLVIGFWLLLLCLLIWLLGMAFSVTDSSNPALTQTADLTLTATVGSAPVANQFITLSSNKHYLFNSVTGKPVFLTGDAPQTLIVQVSNADVDTYLADREARGFNVLWVYPIDLGDQSNAPQDFYGNVPFDGPDFTNEDETYWAHVDYVLQRRKHTESA